MRPVLAISLLFVAATTGCLRLADATAPESLARTSGNPRPRVPSPGTPRIELRLGPSTDLFVGMHMWLTIDAIDAAGVRLSTDRATVTSRGPSGAAMVDTTVCGILDASNRLTLHVRSRFICHGAR